MRIALEHEAEAPVTRTCEALDLSRATYYRWKNRPQSPAPHRRRSPRGLTPEEDAEVLGIVNSERFRDKAVGEIHATILDEDCYICSERTFYRILKRRKLNRQRRHRNEHPVYEKPELLASGPNELWSWDITKIKGPRSWIFFHLYVVIDVYSRYVVAWSLCDHESGDQARALIEAAYQQQRIEHEQLVLHSDRGKAMRSKTLVELLGELGIRQSLNRPHVSNDNPFSESQFKTLKYRPDFPARFGSIEDARSYLRDFFDWYNNEHRHSGIAMMTPKAIHTGEAERIQEKRQQTLQRAYERNPERFVNGRPKPKDLPTEVWINKPKEPAVY